MAYIIDTESDRYDVNYYFCYNEKACLPNISHFPQERSLNKEEDSVVYDERNADIFNTLDFNLECKTIQLVIKWYSTTLKIFKAQCFQCIIN